MGEPTRQPLPGAFVERLLQRVDPHNPACAAETRQSQVVCGRWLALRRLRRRLTREQLAESLGMSAETLLFVETGLADATLASERSWWLLALALSSDRADVEVVQGALRLARGEPSSLSDVVLARVLTELDHAELP